MDEAVQLQINQRPTKCFPERVKFRERILRYQSKENSLTFTLSKEN
jgi:hypothetical protein